MNLLLTGAIPPKSLLPTMTKAIQERAPAYLNWLSRFRASKLNFLGQTICSPYEAIVQQLGFTDHQSPDLIFQAVNIDFDHHHTKMSQVDINSLPSDYAHLLFQSAKDIFQDFGLSLNDTSATEWICPAASSLQAPNISLRAITSGLVSEWWPEDNHYQLYRRLINAVQMQWHSLEIHQQWRQEGQPIACNSIWGEPAAIHCPDPKNLALPNDWEIQDKLYESHFAQDWYTWIESLNELEKTGWFNQALQKYPFIYLVGYDEAYLLKPAKFWQIPFNSSHWKTWWFH